MTKVRLLVLLAVVALLLFPAMASAQGPPLPCRFHGTVQVDGADVADGTVITATIDGDTYTTTTPAAYGASTYGLKIDPPEGTLYAEGTSITFMIGTASAAQLGTWETGGNIELNLVSGEPPIVTNGVAITDVVVITFAAGEQDPSGFDSVTGVLTVGIPAVITSVEYEDLPSGAAGNATLEDGVLTLSVPRGAAGAEGEAGGGANIAIPIIALVLAVIAIVVSVMSIRRRV